MSEFIKNDLENYISKLGLPYKNYVLPKDKLYCYACADQYNKKYFKKHCKTRKHIVNTKKQLTPFMIYNHLLRYNINVLKDFNDNGVYKIIRRDGDNMSEEMENLLNMKIDIWLKRKVIKYILHRHTLYEDVLLKKSQHLLCKDLGKVVLSYLFIK